MSDHIEHACPVCGSYLHPEERCDRMPSVIQEKARERLKQAYPDYPVTFEMLERRIIGASVFNVSEGHVREVTDFIGNLDMEIAVSKGYALIPLVRDRETTVRHYSEYAGSNG